MRPVTTERHFRPRSLDAINFLLADVRGTLGPYLNVFLVTQQHWSQSAVGLVTTIGGLIGLAVQTPIGGRRHRQLGDSLDPSVRAPLESNCACSRHSPDDLKRESIPSKRR